MLNLLRCAPGLYIKKTLYRYKVSNLNKFLKINKYQEHNTQKIMKSPLYDNKESRRKNDIYNSTAKKKTYEIIEVINELKKLRKITPK
jgi:hypothetical protein